MAPGSWDRAAIVAALGEWACWWGARRARTSGARTARPRDRGGAVADRAPALAERRRRRLPLRYLEPRPGGRRAADVAVEHELPRRERVATAVALRAAGETVRSIAEQLGVHPRTVHRYLTASVCSGCGGPALYGERCRECAAGSVGPRPDPRWSPRCGPGPPSTARRRASRTGAGSSPVWARRGRAGRARRPCCACSGPGTPLSRPPGCRRTATPGTRRALERLAAWARAHGRAPRSPTPARDPELPSPSSCRSAYGSWNAALRAAGLTPGREAQWNDERVHAILAGWARWHTRHGSGEPSAASYRQWAARQPGPAPVGVLDPAPLRRLLERRPPRRRLAAFNRRATSDTERRGGTDVHWRAQRIPVDRWRNLDGAVRSVGGRSAAAAWVQRTWSSPRPGSSPVGARGQRGTLTAVAARCGGGAPRVGSVCCRTEEALDVCRLVSPRTSKCLGVGSRSGRVRERGTRVRAGSARRGRRVLPARRQRRDTTSSTTTSTSPTTRRPTR